MQTKNIIRIVLLAVVGVSVGGWAIKEFGPAGGIPEGIGKDVAAIAARSDGVTVIHFHGNNRCRTCIRIGELARQVVEQEFTAEAKAGKLHWEQINYDEPAHARSLKDYGLVSSTVVVTLWADGKELKWNKLDGVWDHVGDEAAFRAYLAGGVRELLAP